MVDTRQAASSTDPSRPSKPSRPEICQVIIPKIAPSAQTSIKLNSRLANLKNPLAQPISDNLLDCHPPQKQQITKQWIDSQRADLVAHPGQPRPIDSIREPGQLNHQEKITGTDHPTRSNIDRSARSESTLEYLDEQPLSSSPTQDRISSFLDLSPTRNPPNHAGLDASNSGRSFDQAIQSTQDQWGGAIFGSLEQNSPQKRHRDGGHLNPARWVLERKSEFPSAVDGHPSTPANDQSSFPKRPGSLSSATLNQTGRSGCSQAHRAIGQTKVINRTLDADTGVDPNLTLSTQQAIHQSRPSPTPKVQTDQPHQYSDLSLADLLNIRKAKNRSNPRNHRQHTRRAKSKTPKSILLSSSSSISSQINTHPNRNKKGLKSWGAKKSKAPKNDENLDRKSRSSDRSRKEDHSTLIETSGKTLTSNSAHRCRKPLESRILSNHRRICENKEFSKLQPRVLVPKQNLISHNTLHRHRQDSSSKEKQSKSDHRSKLPGGRSLKSKSTPRNRSQKTLEDQAYEEELRRDSTPPDRRARLKYYRELDQLKLEEEVVIEV